MSLQNLQAELAEALLANDQNTDIVQPTLYLSIYRNNILANLTRALKETYPLVTKLLGEDSFKITAHEYIKRYPSRSSNLHEYGEYFADFLVAYTPLANVIYLPEVAQFEWLYHNVFFSADHPAFDLKQLEHSSPDQFHFMLHPASRIMKCDYPILPMIDLCKHDMAMTVDLNAGGIHLLIIRRDLDITLHSLTLDDSIFLTTLQESKLVSQAYDEALLINPAFDLEEKLYAWIQDKIIVEGD